jgi:hypothetical protein
LYRALPNRYKQLWQSLGFHNIISARPPMSSIMVPAAGQLLAAKFTHRLLQTAQQRPNAPILVSRVLTQRLCVRQQKHNADLVAAAAAAMAA